MFQNTETGAGQAGAEGHTNPIFRSGSKTWTKREFEPGRAPRVKGTAVHGKKLKYPHAKSQKEIS